MNTRKASAEMHAEELDPFFSAMEVACGADVTRKAHRLEEFFELYDKAFQSDRPLRMKETPYLNVFDVLGAADDENAHSDFIAWLLDPEESHEQNDLFLQSLLGLLRSKGLGPGESILAPVVVQRERPNRTDVSVIAHKQFAIFIENKIRHHETDGQISKMIDEMDSKCAIHCIADTNRFAVFLTIDGEPPNMAGRSAMRVQSLKALELAEALSEGLNSSPSKSQLLVDLLKSYRSTIQKL